MKRTFHGGDRATILLLPTLALVAAVPLLLHRPFAAAVTVVLGGAAVFAWRSAARNRARLRELREALLDRTSELASLEALGRETQATLRLSKVCAALERECRKVLLADRFFVASLEEPTGELRFVHRRPAREDDAEVLERRLVATVSAGRRTVRVHDLAAWDEAGGLGIGEYRSAVAVPLAAGNRLLGVLGLLCRKVGAYGESQSAFLTAAAQYAAAAMQNARPQGDALTDPVSGCLRREPFLRRLDEEYARALRHKTPLSILALDLDGFTRLEREAGRPAGDRHLTAVGHRIRATLRDYDVACRDDRDGFAVLLPGTPGSNARSAAERLRTEIARPAPSASGTSLRTTVSIGLASYSGEIALEPAELLDRARRALHRARRAGGDRVIVG